MDKRYDILFLLWIGTIHHLMDIDQAQEVQTVSAVMAVRDTIGLDGGKEEKIEEDLD